MVVGGNFWFVFLILLKGLLNSEVKVYRMRKGAIDKGRESGEEI